jgi:hypothetical protein
MIIILVLLLIRKTVIQLSINFYLREGGRVKLLALKIIKIQSEKFTEYFVLVGNKFETDRSIRGMWGLGVEKIFCQRIQQ